MTVEDVHYAVRTYGEWTLSRRLRDDRSLVIERHRGILREILEGLTYLHRNHVVHGDLRPDNVLIDPNWSVKLADFGLTFAFSDFQTVQRDDLPYIRPWIEGERLEPAADVYAFGALLYTMLAPDHLSAECAPGATWDLVARLCSRADPRSRPTATLLNDIIFGQGREAIRRVELAAHDPQTLHIARIALRRSTSKVDPDELLVSARSQLLQDLRRTRGVALLFPNNDSVAQYLSILALSHNPDTAFNSLWTNVGARPAADPRSRKRISQPSDIDGDWLMHIKDQFHVDPPTQGTVQRYQFLPEEDRRAMFPSSDELLTRALHAVKRAGDMRAEILRDEPLCYADDVVDMLSKSIPGVDRGQVQAMASTGVLLALPDHGELLFPIFQFDSDTGAPLAIIKNVSDLLDAVHSPWGTLAWWRQGHRVLEGASPKDFLGREGEAAFHLIVDAARVSATGRVA